MKPNIVEVRTTNETKENIASMKSRSVKISPDKVHETLAKHMLVDGFDLVVDLKKSQGNFIYDSRSGKRFLDFFTFFASGPVGLNHPAMQDQAFREKLADVAVNKPSSSDAYTVEMAEFVETFSQVAIPEYLPHLFLIEGWVGIVEADVEDVERVARD